MMFHVIAFPPCYLDVFWGEKEGKSRPHLLISVNTLSPWSELFVTHTRPAFIVLGKEGEVLLPVRVMSRGGARIIC